MCETFSKLRIKTPERCTDVVLVFILVNFGHISHLFLMFLFIDFEQMNVSWVLSNHKAFIIDNEQVLFFYNIHIYSQNVK